MRLSARSIQRRPGVSATSQRDYEGISRGKRRERADDLHTCAQQAGPWCKESAGLKVRDREGAIGPNRTGISTHNACATRAAPASRDYTCTGTLAVRSSLPQLTQAPLIAR